MDSFRVARWLTVLAVAPLLPMPGEATAQEDLVEKGRSIAEEHCIRCHVVKEDNPFTGISSTPSFRLLVTALPDWQARFETFYQRRPHPAIIRFRGVTPPSEDEPPSPTVDLMLEDVEAIAAFAESLHERYEDEGDATSAGQGPDPMIDAGSGPGPGPNPGSGPSASPSPSPIPSPSPGPGSDSGAGPATRPQW